MVVTRCAARAIDFNREVVVDAVVSWRVQQSHSRLDLAIRLVGRHARV